MKQGKVFEKLAARKNVATIVFGDKTCTVTLTNGLSKVCGTAHEARLFIEDKTVPAAAAPKAPAFVAPQPQVQIPAPAIAKCGTSEDTVLVTRDWLIEQTGSDLGVNHTHARLTIGALAAVIAGGAAMAAGY